MHGMAPDLPFTTHGDGCMAMDYQSSEQPHKLPHYAGISRTQNIEEVVAVAPWVAGSLVH
jgi:hypothetical protein